MNRSLVAAAIAPTYSTVYAIVNQVAPLVFALAGATGLAALAAAMRLGPDPGGSAAPVLG